MAPRSAATSCSTRDRASAAPLVNSERVGTITIGPGTSTINAGYNAAPVFGTTSTLTAAALVRTAGGTVNFIGNNSALGVAAANRIAFTTAPATAGNNGGIL